MFAASAIRDLMAQQGACLVQRVRTVVVASAFGIAGMAAAGQPPRAVAGQEALHGRVPTGAPGGGYGETAVQRSTAERRVRELRNRSPAEIRDLRRRGGDEARELVIRDPRRPSLRFSPRTPLVPEKPAGPEPVLSGQRFGSEPVESPRAACLLDARTVCLAPGAGVLELWCARRHLVFHMRASERARRAACPESAIEAVWLRERGAGALSRLEPAPCAAVSACSGVPGPRDAAR